MPGRRCAMFGCKNSRVSTKKNQQAIVYHNFPKTTTLVKATIRQEWVRKCRRPKKFNPDTSQVCSIHFKDSDYERDMQNELLGLPQKKALKKTAVPTQHLPIAEDQSVAEDHSLVELINNLPDFSDTHNAHNADLQKKYDKLLKDYDTLKKELRHVKQSSQQKIKILTAKLNYLKKKSSKGTTPSQERQIVSRQLNSVLTDNQLALLTGRKTRVNWTNYEMSVAFTLRYYSLQCYLYLRSNLGYPLPGLSSLRRWAGRISMSTGLLEDILMFLKLAGENLTTFEKTVVLQFDSVAVKSTFEYDVARDEVIGRHSRMQICMARGLFSNWKQPIFVAFDQRMTKEILLNIIEELHKISYNVVACVGDCRVSNVELWNTLGVDTENTHFEHPQTGKNIYMFADAPHLLKLLRNCLLDTGFSVGNKQINKGPLLELIDLTDSEGINVCNKVSEEHVQCEIQRQDVRLATELISNTVGEALIRYKPGDNEKLAEDLGHFICDMNKWFDIFNSYVKDARIPSKSAFGVHLELQEQHLDMILETVLTIRAQGKRRVQTLQKGMVMSIKSLKALFKDMQCEYNAQYICTHKLNLDSLENFFLQIRSSDPNEVPSPLEAIKRMHFSMLGQKQEILDAQVNTQEHPLEECVVAKVMDTAKVQFDVETETPSISCNYSSEVSFTSTSNPSKDVATEEITSDALEYIAGYLAKKSNTLSELGDYTYETKLDHCYNLPSWVQQLSYGGLIKPTTTWLATVQKWNTHFEQFHGDSIQKGPLVVKKLALRIKTEEEKPLQLIRYFCKLRTIIRINYLNEKNSSSSSKQCKRTFTSIKPNSTGVKRPKIRKLKKVRK